MNHENLVRRIQELGVHVGGKITSRNGFDQNWLVDLRAVLMDPEALDEICKAFWEKYSEANHIHIAGMETAAIPLVTGIVLEGRTRGKSVAGLIIRKERKRTGLGRLIEGQRRFESVCLVDDILNSGKSAEKARVALKQAGLHVKDMFVVVDYCSTAGQRWAAKNHVLLTSLVTLKALVLSLSQNVTPRMAIHYEPKWHYAAPGGFPYYTVPKSAPLFRNNALYFGSDSGAVNCLDCDSGQLRWSFVAPGCGRKGIWSSPAFFRDRIYIGAYNGTFYCFDANDGRVVWSHALCEWIGSSPTIVERYGLVVVGLEFSRQRSRGSICALRLQDGERVWEKLLKEFQHGSGTYSPSSDLLICGTNDHNVLALEARSGRVRWRFDTRRSVKYAPTIDELRGIVAFASFDSSIYIINLKSGEKIAEFPTGSICYTTPLIHGDRLYCGSADKNLYVVDLNSMSLAARMDMRARIFSSPRVIDDGVIFGTCGGLVREIDRATLQVRGEVQVPDSVSNAVAIDETGSQVFVPTSMNEIFAFSRVRC